MPCYFREDFPRHVAVKSDPSLLAIVRALRTPARLTSRQCSPDRTSLLNPLLSTSERSSYFSDFASIRASNEPRAVSAIIALK